MVDMYEREKMKKAAMATPAVRTLTPNNMATVNSTEANRENMKVMGPTGGAMKIPPAPAPSMRQQLANRIGNLPAKKQQQLRKRYLAQQQKKGKV